MKIYKYYPAFFEGFPDVECEVTTKEELLSCKICEPWVKNGFVIAISDLDNDNDFRIMAVKYEPGHSKGSIYYVVSQNISEPESHKQLRDWLPDYREVCKQFYEKKLELKNKHE